MSKPLRVKMNVSLFYYFHGCQYGCVNMRCMTLSMELLKENFGGFQDYFQNIFENQH
jgi:hypothetical protein